MSNAIANITLCRVPITPINQIDFTDVSEQQSYFSSKSSHEYNDCRYQSRTGTIKVKGYVDNLRNCNYGYYRNEYNGTVKTYYFWIVGKNYISREVTEIIIQLDVFQTWMFDFNFNTCMIEREHVSNDGYGFHTIPEDFELGDYVTITRKEVASLKGNPCFILAHSDNGGGIFGKTYNGCHMTYYSFNDTDQLSTDIQEMSNAGKGDAIAYIYQFPENLAGLNLSSGDSVAELIGVCSATETFNSGEQSNQFKLNGNGYIPYNNKMYCYPFMFITVKNSSGGNVVLKIENFKDQGTIAFEIEAVLTPHPTITCTPLEYNGKTRAYDDSITLDDYGLCSWNNDNFANWFAQHQSSINAQSANAYASMKANTLVSGNNYENSLANRDANTAKGILSTGASTLGALGNGNLFGASSSAIVGGANTLIDYNSSTRNAGNDLSNSALMINTNYQNEMRGLMASVQDASVQPNSCKGSTSASGLDVARNSATFYIEQTGIKPEYAKMIDSYFQMFGYKVNAVKIPNFKTREKWNYLKTVNCSVYGDVPFDDCNAINTMFNNGLTVWHSEDDMYNYDTANAIR